uniref:Helix-turn-helix domain-containing protein n=1 Tax=Streptomyces sp. NBC_00180 TaxID=2903632 RepID=A0AAU1IAL3_9ACTN
MGKNDFSRRLWKLREGLELAQAALAKKLNVVYSLISRGESGGYIDPDMAHRWIQAVTPDDPEIQKELQALYNAIHQGREGGRKEGREDEKKAFRERMRQLRTVQGFSQAEVAAAVRVQDSRISDWESGVAIPRIESQERVNRWINFLTEKLQDRENVRTELRQLYEKATATPGRMPLWTD